MRDLAAGIVRLTDLAPGARSRFARLIWRWERAEYGQCRTLAAIHGRARRGTGALFCAIRDGRLLGYADLMPLSAWHYADLRAGRIIEEQLPAHWSARPPRLGASRWYIASLVVAAELRRSRPRLAHAVSQTLQQRIWATIAGQGRFPARALGIGATDAGAAMFRHTGFEQVPATADAIDCRPHFERLIRRRASLAVRTRAARCRAAAAGALRA